MKINVKTVMMLAVIVFLSIAYLDKCNQAKNSANQVIDLTGYKDTAMTYTDKYGNLVEYNKAVELSEQNALALIDNLKWDLKRLKIKKPKTITKIKWRYRVDSILIPITDTLPCDEFIYNAVVDSEYYHVDMTFTNRNITLNNISMSNEQDIIVGVRKNGLFKRNEYVAVVENTNPYIKTIGIQQYIIKPKKKFLEKWWVQGAIGFVCGYAVSRQL